MTNFTLRLDLRAPAFGADPAVLYQAGIEMAEWADDHGFAEIMLSEHHGADDGYLPSPLVYAAAIAARTRRVRLRVSALILPLHDPLRIAEDVAVLDNLSGGRAELVVAGGFLPSEFAMFGRSRARRGQLVEEGIAILAQAWSGEPFDLHGRRVRVTPRPLQRPRPPILLGGSSPAAALRAARIADGFVPATAELWPVYVAECERLGRPVGNVRRLGAFALHVAKDPDAAWARIAPHALHETNSYASWYREGDVSGPYAPFADAQALRATGAYPVLTPEQTVELAESLGDDGWLAVHPLVAGLDPELGWQSLELLGREVLPRLSPATGGAGPGLKRA